MAYNKKLADLILTILFFLSFAATTANAQPVANPSPYPAGTLTNYVRTWSATAPETDPTALQQRPLKDAKQVTQYLDGLGRPLQTVAKQGSLATGSSPTDMVAATVYDPIGREQYKYLPFSSTASDGNFKTDPFVQQATFMQAQYGTQGEQYFYGQTQFEASPLNRDLKTFAPGNSWAGTVNNSGTAQHGIGKQYLVNTSADSVQEWDVDTLGNTTSLGVYADGQLFKNVVTDEHSKQTVVYTDKQGHTVLKKTQLASAPSTGHFGWLCTYYVYDDFDKLRLTIQPKGVELVQAAGWQLSANVLSEFCFQYTYDQRQRMIYKKVPGAAAVNMAYDAKDRLVLNQDGNMAAAGKWMYTLYDTLNRPVSTGLWQTASTPSALQAAAFASGDYPNLSGQTYEELTDTYYDGYAWAGSLVSNLTAFSTTYASSFIQTADNSTWPYPQAVAQSAMTQGMVTGSKVKVLNTSTYLNTVVFYDDKGRQLQTRSENNLGGIDVSTIQYAWAALPMANIVQHQKTGTNPQTHVVATITSYDDLFRPVTVSKTINSSINSVALNTPAKVIDSIYYDKLGQSITRVLSPGFNTKGLQRSNYDYNIRGWLLGMNRSFIAAAAAPITASTTDYFGFELAYDQQSGIMGSANYAAAQFNGNITGTTWKSIGDNKQRRYDYGYDATDRILKADFNQWTGSAFNKTAGVDFSMQMGDGTDPLSAYDANGNILNMQHMGLYKGASIKIDSLVYTYQNNASNRLAKVADLSTVVTTGLGDFKDGTNTGDDYGYDPNGNLNLDNNKKISAIAYNYLNLPDSMPVTGKGTVAYVYDAKGTKLQKITTDTAVHPTKITTTSYDESGFQYVNDTLQFLGQEEGRVRYVPTIGTTTAHFAFDYFLKDQLGNTRMVLTDENPNETIPKLTMELVDTTVNCQYFSNLSATRAIKPNNFNCQVYATYPDTISYAAKITGIDTAFIGPFAARRVMNGDSITIKVESYYRTHDNNASLQPALTVTQSNAALLKQVAAGLVNAGQGSTVAQLLADTALQNSVTNYLAGITVASGKPQAGVYWFSLDQQLKYIAAGSGFSQLGSGGCGFLDPVIPKFSANGYVFVFVANQTPQLFVYYDNLQLTHIHSPVLEETSYYPFGLTMAGISSKSGTLENLHKFNKGSELQHNEFSDGSGLEMYTTQLRDLDPQTGRWWQVDPKIAEGVDPDDETGEITEGMKSQSPYASMDNNPVRHNDPNGDCVGCAVQFFYGALKVAGGAEVAGGGPENPGADVVAAGAVIVGTIGYVGISIYNFFSSDHAAVNTTNNASATSNTDKAKTTTTTNTTNSTASKAQTDANAKTQQTQTNNTTTQTTDDNKPSSPGKMQKEVERNQAPKNVQRVDNAHNPDQGGKPHVHYKDGTSSNNDGTTHDAKNGTPNPVKEVIKWLEKHNWIPPAKP